MTNSPLRNLAVFGMWISIATLSLEVSTRAQSASSATLSSTPTPSARSDGKLGSTKKDTENARRKRGGPNSTPTNEIGATPAEGQSDLIKVLQPGSRQKNNQ